MQQLINDVIKPWDELNDLLAEPYAFEPGLSDVTRMAIAIAIALRHQAELRGVSQEEVLNAAIENKIISDVADAAKHPKLRDSLRQNTLQVDACFQYDEKLGFRFIRNGVMIRHASLGDRDFMQCAVVAIHYWMQRLQQRLKEPLRIKEGPLVFHPSAFLYYNPKYCIQMKRTSFRAFAYLPDKGYVQTDPPEIPFEIRQMPTNNDPQTEIVGLRGVFTSASKKLGTPTT